MTSKRDRVFTFVMAILFLFTSAALTIVVIWQMAVDNKQAPTTQADQSQTVKLAGTKLKDFTPIDHIEKLKTIDTTVGNGKTVKAGDTVTVMYTGALASSGVIFESSVDSGQPVSFPLSGVIEGWQKGIPGMKEGGTRRLLIPSAQAYGAQASQKIPANSDLVFDVTLISIGQ